MSFTGMKRPQKLQQPLQQANAVLPRTTYPMDINMDINRWKRSISFGEQDYIPEESQVKRRKIEI